MDTCTSTHTLKYYHISNFMHALFRKIPGQAEICNMCLSLKQKNGVWVNQIFSN